MNNIGSNRVYRLAVALAVVIFAAALMCFIGMDMPLVCAEVYTERSSATVGGCRSDGRVLYEGKIEHIFTHELVFDTAKAYSPDNSVRNCFDKDHLTACEFSALLSELYNNGYALIKLDTALSGEPIYVPRGKRPIVMSFDDMTYDTRNRGCIDKLKLVDGVVYDHTERAEPQLTRKRENVTLLESFIEAHPDFSIDGGRATICVNGYNGILGYRITPDCRVGQNRLERDKKECAELIGALKKLGYSFASHTYYHRYFNSLSVEDVEKDCQMWQKYIEPVVGKTRILCYPAGEHRAKSAKNEVFKKYGFNVFLCVGNFIGTDYERASTDSVYIYRLPFDGTALRLYKRQYSHLVNTEAIYDKSRFRPFTYRGSYN